MNKIDADGYIIPTILASGYMYGRAKVTMSQFSDDFNYSHATATSVIINDKQHNVQFEFKFKEDPCNHALIWDMFLLKEICLACHEQLYSNKLVTISDIRKALDGDFLGVLTIHDCKCKEKENNLKVTTWQQQIIQEYMDEEKANKQRTVDLFTAIISSLVQHPITEVTNVKISDKLDQLSGVADGIAFFIRASGGFEPNSTRTGDLIRMTKTCPQCAERLDSYTLYNKKQVAQALLGEATVWPTHDCGSCKNRT